MPSRRNTPGFTAADEVERWIVVEPGIPISRLIHGEVHAGSARAQSFAVATTADADLSDIDARIAAIGLETIDFARLLTKRMGWEHDGARGRGRCHQAHLVLANLRVNRPIAPSEYEAVRALLRTEPEVLRSKLNWMLGQPYQPWPAGA